MVQSKILTKFGQLQHYFLEKEDLLNSVRLEKFKHSEEFFVSRTNPEQCEGSISSSLRAWDLRYKNYKEIIEKTIFSTQVHGSNVRIVNKQYEGSIVADGMITKERLFLGLRTADCLPIFFFDSKKKIIAAVHAGWRGIVAGVINNTIVKMSKLGGESKTNFVAIGPHIGVCCYNVNYSRIRQFKKVGFSISRIAKHRESFWYLDLGEAARLQMINLGLRRRNIDVISLCTSCNARFYSTRRDGNSTARMLNIIGLL